MRENRALLAGLGVVVLWASTFPVIRVAAPAMGVIGLSFARLVVAALFLFGFAILTDARVPRRRDLGWIVGCGFFGMAGYQVLLNWGELYVPAGTASIIIAAAPLVSVGVSRLLFDEQITAITVVGSLIALVGVAFVCLARAGLSVSAAVWILVVAMVMQGIYHAIQRPLLTRYTGLEVGTYSIIAGTVMTLPLVPFGLDGLLHAGTGAWLGAIYLGLMPSALGYVLWAYAVARMPMAVSTSLLYLIPLVAVLIAWVWLGELPLMAEFLGGAIVIVGVATISLGPRLLGQQRPTPVAALGAPPPS